MTKLIYHYSKHTLLFEFFAALLLFFIVLALGYFLFLQSTITEWRTNQKQYVVIHNAYLKRHALKIKNANIVLQLKSWQHKHPRFYTAMRAIHASSDATQLLTQLIQNAQFSITGVTTDHKTQAITIESIGKFSNLFLLFLALNHRSLPMIVAKINIVSPNKFSFKFISRGLHGPH